MNDQNKRELKRMLSVLRIQDLQSVLAFAGKPIKGRKQELFERAVRLVDEGYKGPIESKIRELYARTQKYDTSAVASQTPCVTMAPDVKFDPLPFYDKLGEVLPPNVLTPSTRERMQKCSLSFCLNVSQINAILAELRSVGEQKIYDVQVQLRFCQFDSEAASHEDKFPPHIAVAVNFRTASLPPTLPINPNKPNQDPRRPPRPVDVTPLLKLQPMASNRLEITWAQDPGCAWIFTIHLVRRLSPQFLLDRLRDHGLLNKSATDALIRETLERDADNDVAATGLRFSLTCPVGLTKIRVPCKSKNCSHVQCFDALNYLAMNEQKPLWKCPICDKLAPYWDLKIDGRLSELLAIAGCISEITFSADGRVLFDGRPLTKRELAAGSVDAAPAAPLNGLKRAASNPAEASEAKLPKSEPVAPAGSVIDLTETDSDAETAELNAPCEAPARPPTSSASPEVILLSSDDEDDAPPPSAPSVPSVDTAASRSPRQSQLAALFADDPAPAAADASYTAHVVDGSTRLVFRRQSEAVARQRLLADSPGAAGDASPACSAGADSQPDDELRRLSTPLLGATRLSQPSEAGFYFDQAASSSSLGLPVFPDMPPFPSAGAAGFGFFASTLPSTAFPLATAVADERQRAALAHAFRPASNHDVLR